MSLNTRPDVSASGNAIGRLRHQIVRGELAPGAILNQADLAEALGMSRVPVRDALRTLAGEGWVELRGRSGAVVIPLSASDLQELYELRVRIEPLAGRLGVPNVEHADVLRMEQLLEAMKRDDGSVEQRLELNNKFHSILYTRARRPRILHQVEILRMHMHRYMWLAGSTSTKMRSSSDALHSQILEAIRSKDADLTDALLVKHITTSYENILRRMFENADFDL